MTGFLIFIALVFICHQVGLWFVFKKAGQNPVLSLIPVYNYYILLKMAGRPGWHVFLLFVPIWQFITNYNIRTDTIRAFGKMRFIDEVLGVLFFSFYLVYLGLDKKTKYLGQSATPEFKKQHPIVKKPGRDWAEALFFAAVVATLVKAFYIEAYTIPTPSMERSLLVGDFLFVSKTHYGARIPMTPVAFPFVHHTLPLVGGKAYVDFVKFPYYRLPAFEKIENNDIVVFNFPEGDTVILAQQDRSYYQMFREETAPYQGSHVDVDALRKQYLRRNKHVVRPLDKMDNYIKRCVAIAGDTLTIRDAVVYINGKPLPLPENAEYNYVVYTKRPLTKKDLDKYNISLDQIDLNTRRNYTQTGFPFLALTKGAMENMKKDGILDSAVRFYGPKNYQLMQTVFPHTATFRTWNYDNMGPVWIPKKDATLTLTKDNYALYERAIRVYENNPDFTIKGDQFILKGQPITTYTFKQDYYFMMGDNRDNSLDSRFWGFVPHTHVVGKPVFIWLSLDYSQKNFFEKIRWNRMLRTVKLD